MIKNNIIYSTFNDWIFNVSRAQGSYIWEKNGNKLLDFTSAWNVTNLGWNNPEINQAIIDSLKKELIFPSPSPLVSPSVSATPSATPAREATFSSEIVIPEEY